MNNKIRSGFYRVSVKALVLNDARDKFLIVQEDDGWWDIPGGGLDWGEAPHVGLAREVREEMGIELVYMAENPSYFLTSTNKRGTSQIANVIYEVQVKHLDFVPSDECIAVCFVDVNELKALDNVSPNLAVLADLFNPQVHIKK